MDRCLLFGHTSLPRCHSYIGGTRPTFTEGGLLGWDRLSPGRGLFLKQTRPSTDRRLVCASEPASRACFSRGCKAPPGHPLCTMLVGKRPGGRGVSAGHAQQVRQLGCVTAWRPITSGFSPPRYSVVSKDVATPGQYRWPSGFLRDLTVWPLSLCPRAQRRPRARQCGDQPTLPCCTDGLGVLVDLGWVAWPPTQPAEHTSGIQMRTERKGAVGGISAAPVQTQLRPPPHSVRRPLELELVALLSAAQNPDICKTNV